MAITKVSGASPPRTARTTVVPEKKEKPVAAEDRTCTCIICNRSTKKPNTIFYATPFAKASKENGGYARVCKTCIDSIYQRVMEDSGDIYLAVEICCHYLDVPFVRDIARLTQKAKNIKPMTDYIKAISTEAYDKLTYTDTIIDQNAPDGIEKVTGATERDWDKESVQNMNYVKGITGYDPFDDHSYSLEDRRFLYNTMAGYCPDSTIANDSHKLNSIINIVIQLLQVNKLNEAINYELSKPIDQQGDVAKLVTMQKTLYQSIDRMAEKNDISKAKGSKGTNTLTDKMRQIQADGFKEIEVNVFDIEQSKRLRELADMSAKAIIGAINLEDTDYAEVIEEQRDMVVRLTHENKKQAEELRLLKNEKANWVLATQGNDDA